MKTSKIVNGKISDRRNSGGGASGLFLLGILFVGLKLTGFIDWSWALVTLPFWGLSALLVIFVLGVVMVRVTAFSFVHLKRKYWK